MSQGSPRVPGCGRAARIQCGRAEVSSACLLEDEGCWRTATRCCAASRC